jgi:hypothetical protein
MERRQGVEPPNWGNRRNLIHDPPGFAGHASSSHAIRIDRCLPSALLQLANRKVKDPSFVRSRDRGSVLLASARSGAAGLVRERGTQRHGA